MARLYDSPARRKLRGQLRFSQPSPEPLSHKNVDGHLGPICNNCGGYGFTNSIGGASSGCQHCAQTGIATPDIRTLADVVKDLQQRVERLEKRRK